MSRTYTHRSKTDAPARRDRKRAGGIRRRPIQTEWKGMKR